MGFARTYFAGRPLSVTTPFAEEDGMLFECFLSLLLRLKWTKKALA